MKKSEAMTVIPRRGLLLVMSSPSGAGKTTLSRRLLAADPNIAMSVSVTTRAPRPGEVNGKDYHFITHEEFARLRDRGDLLEYAEVFGNFYGTPKRPVTEALQAGRDVLFDIDWQGTQQLGAAMGEDLVRIFILPPSAEELRERLIGRAQDSARIDRLTFLQLDRSDRRTASDRSSSVATTANQHWTWRQLDNPVLPTDGTSVALQGGLGQAWDHTGTRGTFGRAWSRIQWFRPVGRTWYAQARLEAGQVIAPNALEVPDVLLFRAGGDDSVRGYAYRSLGPVVGSAVGSGKSLATASVEIARPISKELPQFWGAAFVDAGRAANTFSDLKPAVGVGVGVRWRSPVGPLRLDIARGRETGENRLHFSLGIAF